MDLTVHLLLCALLAAALVGVNLYRKRLTVDEDHPLHLGGMPATATANPAYEKRCGQLERGQTILTVVLTVYALGLLGYVLYQEFGHMSS